MSKIVSVFPAAFDCTFVGREGTHSKESEEGIQNHGLKIEKEGLDVWLSKKEKK